MSSQTGRIHVTGGVDSHGKLLHDMWQYYFEEGKLTKLETKNITSLEQMDEIGKEVRLKRASKVESSEEPEVNLLLKRSNHSMVTVQAGLTQIETGQTLIEYTSYIFGGLVVNELGQQLTSNDLLEVRSRGFDKEVK